MAAKKKHVKSRTKPLRGNDVPAPKTPPASISKPYTIAEATEDGHRTGYAIGCEGGVKHGHTYGAWYGAFMTVSTALVVYGLYKACLWLSVILT